MAEYAHDFCAHVAQKGHFGAAVTAATAASDPNQSFQGRVWTLDSGWKHLVGFKYAGWGLLHRPKDGSLLQLRTLFVQALRPFWGCRQRRLSRFLTSNKVFKVEYSH